MYGASRLHLRRVPYVVAKTCRSGWLGRRARVRLCQAMCLFGRAESALAPLDLIMYNAAAKALEPGAVFPALACLRARGQTTVCPLASGVGTFGGPALGRFYDERFRHRSGPKSLKIWPAPAPQGSDFDESRCRRHHAMPKFCSAASTCAGRRVFRSIPSSWRPIFRPSSATYTSHPSDWIAGL